MRESTLRRVHGRVGVLLALFIVVQSVSGIALGWRLAGRSGVLEWFAGPGSFLQKSEGTLRLIHSGSHGPGLLYNLLLGLGLVWMAVSGTIIYLRSRRRRSGPP
jgi:hypothetical protein